MGAGGPALAQYDEFQERVVSVRGTPRQYLVHIPPNVASPAPVVFLFHGGGGGPERIAQNSGMNEAADQHGFIVVYPTGGRASSGGNTWAVGGRINSGSTNDVALVRASLADLGASIPIDRGRIYATGISIGGVFAYRLACEMSGTFAAIAPVAATMVEPSCHPSSAVAVLHIHGTDDARIPLNGGRGEFTAGNRSWPAPERGLSSWARLDGCAGQPSQAEDGQATCTTYDQCRATVEYCIIPGGRHSWPSGAAERIWAFFAANPKR